MTIVDLHKPVRNCTQILSPVEELEKEKAKGTETYPRVGKMGTCPHTSTRQQMESVRANQEYVKVLRKPVKVVQISVQLLRKLIRVKTKFQKKMLNFSFKSSQKF